MLRVIAGKYKRTPLLTLEGDQITRPTRDMVREALFSTIFINEDTSFLDLFSGSGAIGIEALSRGAGDVVFNDGSKEAVKIIRKNLDRVREDRQVCQLDYEDCLREMKGRGFDYVYCDPPYSFGEHERLFSLLKEHAVLNDKGIVIFEVRKDTDLSDSCGDMKQYKEKRYGINKLLYYRKEEKQ